MGTSTAVAGGGANIGAQVRAELRLAFSPPFEWLQIIAFNIALVLICWFALGPETISRLSGIIFLPAVMASWAFADVPATNLYAARPEVALAVLDDPQGLRRLILVRNLALWAVVSPVTAALAVWLSWDLDQWQAGIMVAAVIMGLPMGFFGGTAILAPLLPYHQLPLRERWARRETWLRWATAVIAPYFLINPLALVLLLPGFLAYRGLGETKGAFLAAVLVVATWTWAFRRLTVDLTLRLTANRREALRAFLSDPSRG